MSWTPTDAEDDSYEYSCDLPSCSVTTVYEPVEEDEYPPEPPPTWFSVQVNEHDARRDALVYCSHAHMVEGIDEHLPEPEHLSILPEQDSWLQTVGCGLAVLAFLAVLVLGLIESVLLLVDLAAWAVRAF